MLGYTNATCEGRLSESNEEEEDLRDTKLKRVLVRSTAQFVDSGEKTDELYLNLENKNFISNTKTLGN